MKFSWKKFLILLACFIGFIILPVLLCCNSMMDVYQRRIDRQPDTPFNKWLQLASADVCFNTMRPELAADHYRRFWERYKDDERRPYAWLRYAKSLADSGRNADAVAAFQKYLDDYPDREDKKEAAAGIERIKFVRP